MSLLKFKLPEVAIVNCFRTEIDNREEKGEGRREERGKERREKREGRREERGKERRRKVEKEGEMLV